MAAHVGTKGVITASTGGLASLNVSGWSLDMGMETVDATAFSPTKNSRTKLPGLSSHSGNLEGFLDDTNVLATAATFEQTVLPTVCAMVLTATTGKTYTFDAYLTGFSANVRVGEVATWTATFDVTGDVAIA